MSEDFTSSPVSSPAAVGAEPASTPRDLVRALIVGKLRGMWSLWAIGAMGDQEALAACKTALKQYPDLDVAKDFILELDGLVLSGDRGDESSTALFS